MSVTIGLVLRYDQAPAVPVPTTVPPAPVLQGVWVSPKKVEPVHTSLNSFQQSASGGFPAYSSTTYGPRGEPNRPWFPQQGHLDLYA